MTGSRLLTFLCWLTWAGYGGLLFWLSSRPVAPALGRLSDKLLHLGAYALFEFLLLSAMSRGLRRRPSPAALAAALAIAAAYGLSDEWHQSWVDGRFASGLDLVADVAGAAAGLLFFLLLLSWRERGGGGRDGRGAAGRGALANGGEGERRGRGPANP